MQNADSTGRAKTSKKTLAKLRSDGSNGLPDPERFEALLAKFKPLCANVLKKHSLDIGDRLFPRFPMYLK